MGRRNRINNKVTMIDPPSGWRYEFPKPIPQDRLKDVNTWLVEQGYPQSEIDSLGDLFFCRFWESEFKVNSDKGKKCVHGCLAKKPKSESVKTIVNLKTNKMSTFSKPVDFTRKALVFSVAEDFLKTNDFVNIDEIKKTLRQDHGSYYWNTEFVRIAMLSFCKERAYKAASPDVYCKSTYKSKPTAAPVSTPAENQSSTKKTKSPKKDKWASNETLSKSKALWMMENNKGRFFSVQFIKKGDKTLRTMNCQFLPGQKINLGVVKVKEASLVRSCEPNPIRSFDISTVKKISIGGNVYSIR